MMIADTNEGKPKPYSSQCGAPKGVAPYEHECRKTKNNRIPRNQGGEKPSSPPRYIPAT